MPMVINSNIASMNAQRSISWSQEDLQSAMERLSTGLRVNSARDDAAGMSIASRMSSQINGMRMAIRNANDGISMCQTAEGSMGTLTELMQRMRDLAVQSSNFASNSLDDRKKMNNEFSQLGSEVKRVIQNTTFNNKTILSGSLQGNFQIGANTGTDNQISVQISNLLAASGVSMVIAMAGSAGIGSVTSTRVRSVISALDNAIEKVDKFRSTLGALQSRFASAVDNLMDSIENQSTARSRIMDADFSEETANLSRAQILQQAGTAMLQQANQSPQGVLVLLR